MGRIPEALDDSRILIDIDPQESKLDEIVENYTQEIFCFMDNEDIIYPHCRKKAFTLAKRI